jgi:septum formation protein
MSLLLASASTIRRDMLAAAGVKVMVQPADVDEGRFKQAGLDQAELATELAAAKAQAVSASYPEAWVIGSDSTVEVAGRPFSKPASREEAAEHLRFFAGKQMRLISAVALARGGEVDWKGSDAALLEVRELSEPFIQDYLDAEWPEVGYCVGVFRMEGRGVQLFWQIEGSHFTILGMPLLPLLGALRERGLLPS